MVNFHPTHWPVLVLVTTNDLSQASIVKDEIILLAFGFCVTEEMPDMVAIAYAFF
jgi:hypothetical protein